MTLDPQVALALAVQAHKGIYALLLGSGLSRAAGIPTGYEVISNLIGRMAAASSEQITGEPLDWYKTKFGKDARYSDILELLAPTTDKLRARDPSETITSKKNE